jgi:queuine tRNA-ribosyltransferase
MAVGSSISGQGRKLAFEILSHVDPNILGPRLGKLVVSDRKDLETPNFFAIGSRGVVPHMTPDVIATHTNFGGVYMALEDCGFSYDHVSYFV